jgi:excisionase family DNA binding protein
MTTMNDNGREFWTRREIADYLRLTERTVDAFRKRGLLQPVRVGSNSVRFRRDDVMALVAERRA